MDAGHGPVHSRCGEGVRYLGEPFRLLGCRTQSLAPIKQDIAVRSWFLRSICTLRRLFKLRVHGKHRHE